MRWLHTIAVLAISSVSSTAHAVSINSEDVDQLISRGSTMHVVDSEQQKVECEDLKYLPITIVPAGIDLVRFKNRFITCDGINRYLVLTKQGLWGYWRTPKNTNVSDRHGNTYWKPEELQSSASEMGNAAIVTRDGFWTARDEGTSKQVYLTHAETYKFTGFNGIEQCILSPASYGDARSKHLSSVDAKLEGSCDFIKIQYIASSDPRGLHNQDRKRRDTIRLYNSIKQIRPFGVVEFSKSCGEKVVVAKTEKGIVYAGAGIDISAKEFRVTAGMEGEVRYEIQSLRHYPESINIFTKVFQMDQYRYVFKLRRYNSCRQIGGVYVSSRLFYHYYIGTEAKELAINSSFVDTVNRKLGLKLSFNDRRGKIELSCIAEYLKLLDFLIRDYRKEESSFLLSRVIKLDDPRDIGDCRRSKP